MGPLRETKVWSTRSVDGVHRFLGRVWRLVEAHSRAENVQVASQLQLTTLHRTIKRVTGALEAQDVNCNRQFIPGRRGHGGTAI